MQPRMEPPARKWRQHLTLELPEARPGCVWIHACSVGEVGSVAPLAEALLARGLPVHLTVVTRTGHAHARKLLGDRIGLSWLPWDAPGLMQRFVRRLAPGLLLLAETEFWPGMLRACRRAGAPIVGVNTRISDRSFPRYRATRWLWRRWLSPVALFLAQSELDAERLRAMGVEAARVRVTGNLKYAVRAPGVDAAALRRRLDASQRRPILLAASTHEGEEAALLDMWPEWRRARPDLLLALVPRHPERFEAVARLAESRGFRLARWSAGDAPAAADLVLVDAMGVLAGLYAVADIAFIGGSLANIGGHNPLEAAVCGRGAITGPHVQNFRAVMRDMQRAGAAIVAADAGELNAAILRLLQQPEELARLNASAAAFMQDKSAVLPHTMAAIEPFLPEAAPSP